MRIAFALFIAWVVLLACGAITAGAIVSDVPALAATAVDAILIPWGILMVWMVDEG